MNKKIKIIGLTSLGILALNTVCAQQWQFGISGGYGVGLATSNASNYKASSDPNSSNTIEKYTTVKNEFGKGLNLQMNATYMFNENIGLDLGLSYLMGSKVITLDENTTSTQESTTQLNMYRMLPSLVVATSLNDVNLYMKFGFNVGTGNMEMNMINTSAQQYATAKLSGGYSLGTQAAVGMDFPISDNIKITGEIYYVSSNYAPTFLEITKMDMGGVNYLDNITVSEKQTNLVDNYIDNGNNDKTKPSTGLKEYYTVGSVGLQIGLKFILD